MTNPQAGVSRAEAPRDEEREPPGDFARRLLVLFAHPALEKSRVNRRLVREPQSLPGVTFHDLYEAYPDFDVRVDREQELLARHDVVVLQHPVFWYSTPALVKEWQDLVLEHGWAYGSKGTALRGKWVLQAVTSGGREQAYRADGSNRFTIREFLRPVEQTMRLCRMEYLPPFVVHGTHRMGEGDLEAHASSYRRLLEALRDDRVDLEAVRDLQRLNGPDGPFARRPSAEERSADDA